VGKWGISNKTPTPQHPKTPTPQNPNTQHPMKLTQLFKKTPQTWLQVTREKTRLIVAIAGIAFADLLIFTQLVFLDALFDASV